MVFQQWAPRSKKWHQVTMRGTYKMLLETSHILFFDMVEGWECRPNYKTPLNVFPAPQRRMRKKKKESNKIISNITLKGLAISRKIKAQDTNTTKIFCCYLLWFNLTYTLLSLLMMILSCCILTDACSLKSSTHHLSLCHLYI